MVLVWDDDILDYVQERDELNRPVRFETFEDVSAYIYSARAKEVAHGLEPRQRRHEYRTVRRRGRKNG